MMTSDDDERGLMKQDDDDVDKYDGGEGDAQCHEVEQEEFQFIFCLIIKYFPQNNQHSHSHTLYVQSVLFALVVPELMSDEC